MYRSPAMKREPMPKNPMKLPVWNGQRNRKARIPKKYYGDEIGMEGDKDPDYRRCYPVIRGIGSSEQPATPRTGGVEGVFRRVYVIG